MKNRSPSSGDEESMPAENDVTMRMIQASRPRKTSTFSERVRRFSPGIFLMIFSICKLAFVLFCMINRPLNQVEVPIAVTMLCINAILLLAASNQDYFSLIVSWVITATVFTLYLVLLVTVPIFVTSFFASDAARYTTVPHEFRIFRELIDYRSRQDKLFVEGIEYGMSVELVLGILVFVTGIQLALINATLNAKLDHSKRQRQEREKRNSVYLI